MHRAIASCAILASMTTATMECSFKINYFSEFDLENLQKLDSLPYSTKEVAFLRDFEFSFCEPMKLDECDDPTNQFNICPAPIKGENIYARMRSLPDGEYIEFGEPVSQKAYDQPYGERLVGSRGKGSVHGVKLTYEIDEICDVEKQVKTQMTVAVECSEE